MKRYFPDVNVWFALAVGDHPHHRAARHWWSGEFDIAAFCRLTEIGLLRLLTTASAMGGAPLANAEAWSVWKRLQEDSRVRSLPELPAMDALFERASSLPTASPKRWADAYLAAYAQAHRATLVTFDSALPGLLDDCVVLGRRP